MRCERDNRHQPGYRQNPSATTYMMPCRDGSFEPQARRIESFGVVGPKLARNLRCRRAKMSRSTGTRARMKTPGRERQSARRPLVAADIGARGCHDPTSHLVYFVLGVLVLTQCIRAPQSCRFFQFVRCENERRRTPCGMRCTLLVNGVDGVSVHGGSCCQHTAKRCSTL